MFCSGLPRQDRAEIHEFKHINEQTTLHKKMKVKIVNRSSYPAPEYATEMSAGMDLKAEIQEPVILNPLCRTMVPTGLSISLPQGYEAQIRPRSGLAAKHGITVLNTPGTIDADAAEELLGAYVGKTEAEIADQLTKWDYERETGLKYGNMKDDYISGTVDRATALAYYSEESVSRWDYERETGLAYDDMRDDYLSGLLSESQTREYLMAYGGKTDEKADEQLDRWDYYAVTGDSEGYTKYWRMYYAFENGGDFRRYASEWIDAGVKKSYIASSIAGRYKEEYLAIKGTAAGDAMLEHLLDLYEAIGYDRDYERNYINNKWQTN